MSDSDTGPPAAASKVRRAPPPQRKPAAATKTTATAVANVPTPRAHPPAATSAAADTASLIRVPLSVRWRDLDAFNHVNNSQFLSYLEEARLRWMLSVPGQDLDNEVAPVVAAANLNYRRPIEWPGEIAIELFVERLGNSSVSIGHRIVDANDAGVLYCDGSVVMVWIDRSTGSAAPLPAAVREACSSQGS
jgi:acyl-CoA thioester hydrolase